MTQPPRFLLLLVLLLLLAGVPGAGAQNGPADHRVLLPAVRSVPPSQPFSVNLPAHYNTPTSLGLTRALNPRWAHGSTISWYQLEPEPGVYRWEELAVIERSVTQLRAAGIEPIVLITDSPPWAQKYPGWRCSPPAPEHVGAFLSMLETLSARYREGASAIRYWEVWNEPDAFHEDIPKSEGGIGCWAERAKAVESGQLYGTVMQQAAAALKRGNPDAQVIGGALTYWVADDYTVGFLQGMIASGGLNAVDALSFHAYGETANDDWLVIKTNRLRQQLAAAGYGDKPLLATEVGAPCPQGINSPACDPQTTTGTTFSMIDQPRYAARIPAESLALGLLGSVWYPVVNQSPGFAYSHIVDVTGGELVPRPAYYALRNVIKLLEGASYDGPPLIEATADQPGDVRMLSFQRPIGQLYALWTHQANGSGTVQIPVPAGMRATCWEDLELSSPTVTDCTPAGWSSVITRTVGPDPQYVEVGP